MEGERTEYTSYFKFTSALQKYIVSSYTGSETLENYMPKKSLTA